MASVRGLSVPLRPLILTARRKPGCRSIPLSALVPVAKSSQIAVRRISTTRPNLASFWGGRGDSGNNKNDNKDSAKKSDKEKTKADDEKESEDSLFDSLAPKSESRPDLFENLDMSVDYRRRQAEMTKTDEERERDRLNEALDRYDTDTETEKLVEQVDGAEQKAITKPDDDAELMARIRPEPKTALDHYLGPLRKAVYLKQTTGVEDLLIKGKKYKLKLTKREKELIEPSVWLKSNTQRGSVKKVTPFLRSLRRMNIHQAIAHCHFNTKAIARDVEKLLYRGIDEAKAMGIPEKGMYIDQIWSGKEPKPKAVQPFLKDIKGRGRMGIMKRKEHHVQVILKTPVTKRRIAKEKEEKMINKKPWIPVTNKPIYDKSGAHYTW
ncbi:hypothetical protein V1517DRAFT_69360 [Lipomyces orientalis]|uniref:Uncharacterized protein n=1 Tax=Lipomyces orientalis TaxID=1233043 RepID=A0ACC3U100_9ASCO